VNYLSNIYYIYYKIILESDCVPSEKIINKPFHAITSKEGLRSCRVKFNEEYFIYI